MNCEPYQPAPGLSNRHLQTLFPAIFRKQPRPEIEIECFELDDGDFVECFWHHKPDHDNQIPIVVLFHGLEGSFESPYIQGIMHALKKAGFCSVLMHFRGCSGRMNRLPRSYHSGDTADAKAWIKTLQQRYPQSPLFSVGYSLGGNMLLKLLAEWGATSPISAAVSVSAPLQLDVCAKRMNKGFSRFYQYILLRELKRSLLKKYTIYNMKSLLGVDEQEIKQLKSLWAFDDVYTGPVHGFSSASDYYEKSSSKQYLQDIVTKTLLIHALDDPFMTHEVLPDRDEISSEVQLELHSTGGHLGFVSGSLIKPEYWLEKRITTYFKNLL
ncbi:MAG: hydrolase [Gammaproteobacteria bacterium]|nr:hydrolase [Gammaproteobacteria bacterium]